MEVDQKIRYNRAHIDRARRTWSAQRILVFTVFDPYSSKRSAIAFMLR